MADLIFYRPVTPTPGQVDLIFGDVVAPVVVIAGSMLADLPAVNVPALVFDGAADVNLSLPDADGASMGTRQQQALPISATRAVSQQQAEKTATCRAVRQQQAIPLAGSCGVMQQQMIATRHALRITQQHGMPLRAHICTRQQETIKTRLGMAVRHQHGKPRGRGFAQAQQETIKTRTQFETHHQHMLPLHAGLSLRGRHGEAVVVLLRLREQQMIPLPVGWSEGTYPWPEPPSPGYSGEVLLRFARPLDVTHDLIFNWHGAHRPGAEVPVREVYFVINEFTLVRADTGQPVKALGFSASLDYQSWGWSWSARIAAQDLPLVKSARPGERVELIATINGHALYLVVDRPTRNRVFGDTTVDVTGQGRAAWLAEPLSEAINCYNTADMTAQQLLADALTINGVSIGWALDWRVPDWLVPRYCWTHTGTYMTAACRIAEAAGGYVQAHDTDKTLIILPKYPALPWAWDNQVPDIVLPEDACNSETTEQDDRPLYNAVYVTGNAGGGRNDRIVRAGTAGDRFAPSILDPLATHTDMTRARGGVALAECGRHEPITVRLPVLPETGIIKPGLFVQYRAEGQARIGLTRAVSIEQGFPDLWQTIQIETQQREP